FALTTRHARGTVLRVEPRGPRYDTQRYADVPLVTATATHDEETGAVTLIAVNRDQSAPVSLEADVRAFGTGSLALVEHVALADRDIGATNTEADPERVRPRPVDDTALDDGRLTATLAPVSWNLIRLSRQ
ncbi:MAG TPA: alpha-L-arabinofuranosidase C-terminal domain-containing protein, partial [Actinopolymorphaceae bacterium]|nr:alpha-L-arabinofuranosidase C-terminal domain-containing protein [Actinopolymorphaceae bacterium]